MYEKSFYILQGCINGRFVIQVDRNLGGQFDFVKWITDKCLAGIRPVNVTNSYIVFGASNCCVFMEPLEGGESIITVLGP